MKTIELDTGIEEFSVAGGGVLRFNPRDPNLYARFLEAAEQMQALEDRLNALSAEENADPIALTAKADKELKALLDRVFAGNDFHRALGGVSLLAVTGNGKRVVENLFNALEQILTEGAAQFAAARAETLRAEV